jgi:transposase-like protein
MMNSTVGRPRALTDTQIAEILRWHASRQTVADVARHYGVSSNTIAAVIRRGGVYKQASPEQRQTALAAYRRRREALIERALL